VTRTFPAGISCSWHTVTGQELTAYPSQVSSKRPPRRGDNAAPLIIIVQPEHNDIIGTKLLSTRTNILQWSSNSVTYITGCLYIVQMLPLDLPWQEFLSRLFLHSNAVPVTTCQHYVCQSIEMAAPNKSDTQCSLWNHAAMVTRCSCSRLSVLNPQGTPTQGGVGYKAFLTQNHFCLKKVLPVCLQIDRCQCPTK
jgi:hypothetical protein